jgi:hypothetical protein
MTINQQQNVIPGNYENIHIISHLCKYHLRKMSGLTMGSIGLRSSNMTTPKELCDLLGGSRVINKV